MDRAIEDALKALRRRLPVLAVVFVGAVLVSLISKGLGAGFVFLVVMAAVVVLAVWPVETKRDGGDP